MEVLFIFGGVILAKFLVKNAGPLHGEVTISGSKNSVLPIMAAALLSDDPCTILDVPALSDVEVMCDILESIGATIEKDYEAGRIVIDANHELRSETPAELGQRMRASILTMGPLLARDGRTRASLPGGCAIGARPIDLHLKGFEAMGAEIIFDEEAGTVTAITDGHLHGARIYLDYPSVGATENIMAAAVLAEGQTIMENVAQEPEIVDLANYLNKMGARVKGAGTDIIKIDGVKSLHGTEHNVIPDRIETGTFMVAAAITRGDVLVKNVVPDHVRPIIAKLLECGCQVEEAGDDLDELRVRGDIKELRGTDIKTLPYPGFPTDMQSQFMALLTTVHGSSTVIETVFENRYMHISELNRMGAGIRTEDKSALIPGDVKLKGTQVVATDLRAGAALVLAGLAAEGETEILEIRHIERGYAGLVEKLQGIGADIRRVD
ncbi:MAG: UDP-N-acetylglucosamine 1-carboxyvinyltransferase [Firmicutes bacterium]|nr:UDP-N-acetylglucosamine 1-carboxyvinyltransferase [Bacillota bacterium]